MVSAQSERQASSENAAAWYQLAEESIEWSLLDQVAGVECELQALSVNAAAGY